jgi:hypothetical protein
MILSMFRRNFLTVYPKKGSNVLIRLSGLNALLRLAREDVVENEDFCCEFEILCRIAEFEGAACLEIGILKTLASEARIGECGRMLVGLCVTQSMPLSGWAWFFYSQKRGE